MGACERQGHAVVRGLNEAAVMVHVLDAASAIQNLIRQWRATGGVDRLYIATPNPPPVPISLGDHVAAALAAADLHSCSLHAADAAAAAADQPDFDYLQADAVSFPFATDFTGTQAAAAAGRDWRVRRGGGGAP